MIHPTLTVSSPWAGFVPEGFQWLARCWHVEIWAEVTVAGYPLHVLWVDLLIPLGFNLEGGKGSKSVLTG